MFQSNNSFDRTKFFYEIDQEEGYRSRPYKDTRGFLTVGRGWNLDTNPLPREVIDLMTDLAINRCEQFLNDYRPRWRELDPARQRVLLHMCYNMGPVTLMTFRRFWAAFDTWVDKKDNRYLNVMAREIRDSRAHQQLPNRYDKLADIMEADKHGQGMDTKGDQETGGVQGQG